MCRADLLLFAAHCDDGELWAGGTVAQMTQSGTRVVLAVANHDPVRRAEAGASAAVLQCEIKFREVGEDLATWASEVLMSEAPEVVACHPTSDPHYEHSG